MSNFRLRKPEAALLPAYVAALERGWSPDNLRAETSRDELLAIRQDPDSFVAALDDPDAQGGPVVLPDGSHVLRLPGFRRWMWDEDFCGHIGFRWRRGSSELPPHCLGHIGYSVPQWRRGHGYATRGLALMLDEIRAIGDPGLSYVELTTDPDNGPSQSVIRANGGVFVERFAAAAAYDHKPELRFRIAL